MFRLNKRLEYGIIALLYLAAEKDRVASVHEMATQCRIPEALLSKLMQALKAKQVVCASHGNHGGYRLQVPLADINLLDLTQTLVGPVQLAECFEPGSRKCPVQSACSIMTPMSLLNQKIALLFQGTSIESLVSRKVSS